MHNASRSAIVVAVALLTAVVTWGLGWWGVVPVAAVVGWYFRDVRRIAAWTALGSLLGWAVLLGGDALGGRFGPLAHALGGTLGVPAVALVLLTLALPALLGWSAAKVAVFAARSEYLDADDRMA